MKFNRNWPHQHRNWPFQDTISVFGGEFRKQLAGLGRCTLNKGAFAFKIVRGWGGWGGALKWPLKGGSRLIGLIEVAPTAGLTVYILSFHCQLQINFFLSSFKSANNLKTFVSNYYLYTTIYFASGLQIFFKIGGPK